MIDAFKNGEYALIGLRRVNPDRPRLEYAPMRTPMAEPSACVRRLKPSASRSVESTNSVSGLRGLRHLDERFVSCRHRPRHNWLQECGGECGQTPIDPSTDPDSGVPRVAPTESDSSLSAESNSGSSTTSRERQSLTVLTSLVDVAFRDGRFVAIGGGLR